MKQRGILTLELIISLGLLATILTAVFLMSFSSQSLLIDSQNSNDALIKAQEVLEAAKNMAKVDFDSVANSTETDGIFTKNLIVTELDAITKKISAEVTWNNGAKKVDLYNIIANFSNGPGANTCSFVMNGNWNSPQTYSFKLSSLWGSELAADSNGIYTITGLDAYLGKLYVTAESSATPNVTDTQKDFFVLNLANPLSPTLLSRTDNDTSTAVGLNTVHVSSKYAYTTSATGSNGQLQIFDVTYSPPRLIENFQVAGGLAGTSLFYKDSKVYLGTANNTGGSEFFIIDVTDPTTPSVVGTAEIGATVNDIYIHGNYAYVVSGANQVLKVFDISNPTTNMQTVGSYTSPYAPSGANNQGKRVFVLGDKIYLARTQGTNEFYILDTTNPASISELGHLDIASSTDLNGIAIRGDVAFLATTGSQLQVYNISDPASITQYMSPISLTRPASALDCEGNHIYAATNDGSGNGYITVVTGS